MLAGREIAVVLELVRDPPVVDMARRTDCERPMVVLPPRKDDFKSKDVSACPVLGLGMNDGVGGRAGTCCVSEALMVA